MSLTPLPLMLASHVLMAQGRLLQIHPEVPTVRRCTAPRGRTKGHSASTPGEGIPGGRNLEKVQSRKQKVWRVQLEAAVGGESGRGAGQVERAASYRSTC